MRAVAGSLRVEETGLSVLAHRHEAWDPEWIQKRFVVLLRCASDECGEVVACAGDVAVVEEQDYSPNGEPDETWNDQFTPKYFRPTILFFRLEAEYPEEVQKHLERAFALAWSDTASALNALRVALEELLTDRKIPRTTVMVKETGLRSPCIVGSVCLPAKTLRPQNIFWA